MADFKYYERGGRKYHRVTTVLDYFPCPELVEWKVRVGKAEAGRISRKAFKDGSRIDELCEADWRTGKYKLKKSDNAEVRSAMQGWEQWKDEWSDVYADIQGMQETVFSDAWGVAGTLDIRTSKAIIDIKGAQRISKNYWVQTAFYNSGFGLPNCYILRLGKSEGTYEFIPRPEEYSQDYLEEIIKSYVNVYNYNKKEEERDGGCL